MNSYFSYITQPIPASAKDIMALKSDTFLLKDCVKIQLIDYITDRRCLAPLIFEMQGAKLQ